MCLEKGLVEVQQDGEVEEGVIFDGEKKREGVIFWVLFKKMVMFKKCVRWFLESDKEDELDKVKSVILFFIESVVFEM